MHKRLEFSLYLPSILFTFPAMPASKTFIWLRPPPEGATSLSLISLKELITHDQSDEEVDEVIGDDVQQIQGTGVGCL
jgi:hypothetical protein